MRPLPLTPHQFKLNVNSFLQLAIFHFTTVREKILPFVIFANNTIFLYAIGIDIKHIFCPAYLDEIKFEIEGLKVIDL